MAKGKPPAPSLELLRNLGVRDRKPPCKVAAALKGLDGKEFLVLMTALSGDNEDERRGARKWLKRKHGRDISPSALAHHRAQRCSCHAPQL